MRIVNELKRLIEPTKFDIGIFYKLMVSSGNSVIFFVK